MMKSSIILLPTAGYGGLRIGRVMAMARPARGMGEAEAIRLAFAAMPLQLSARAKAARLAKAVARAIVLVSEPRDTVERALAELHQLSCPSPAVALAIDPVANLIRYVAEERVRRFKARQCRYSTAQEWADETREIEKMLQRRLAERFRRA